MSLPIGIAMTNSCNGPRGLFSVSPSKQPPHIIKFKRSNSKKKILCLHAFQGQGWECRSNYVERAGCLHRPAVILPCSCSIPHQISLPIGMAMANSSNGTSGLFSVSPSKQQPHIVKFKRSNSKTKLLYLHTCQRQGWECRSNYVERTGCLQRPAVILPGLGKNSSDYQQLASSLEAKGVRTIVAKISRLDWLRYAAGLLDGNFWKGTLRPRPLLDWYLKRIKDAVDEANLIASGGKISLIGHSIGGWIARVYLEEFGVDEISLLLTLGTPHRPPPKGLLGVIDQTRGLLDYVDKYCPVANHELKMKYVCIAGRYIKGECFKIPKIKASNMESIAGVNGSLLMTNRHNDIQYINNDMKGKSMEGLTSQKLHARIVGEVYKQICGQADVWGDGVVPEISSHLEGATNITLEGVYHSPNNLGDISKPWYGSNTILDKWAHHLID